MKWMPWIMLLALGCGEANTESTADAETCTALDYESFGASFFEEYCASCHAASGSARNGAPASDVFDSLSDVRSASDAIKMEVVTLRTMPPSNASAQPTSDERTLLGEWLDCGSP